MLLYFTYGRLPWPYVTMLPVLFVCVIWAAFADYFVDGSGRLFRKMRRLNASDCLPLMFEPEFCVAYGVKLGKLENGDQSLQDLREHLLAEFCKYPRFRSSIETVLGVHYFREIDDDAVLDKAVQIVEDPMSEKEVCSFIEGLLTKDFGRGGPQFSIDLIRSKDSDGVYVVFKVHHALSDGMSFMNVLSKAQDGGEAAHKEKGTRFPKRAKHSISEQLQNLGNFDQYQKEFEEKAKVRSSIIRKDIIPTTHRHHVFVTEDMSVSDIKKQAKLHGATVNEYFHAVLAHSVNHFTP